MVLPTTYLGPEDYYRTLLSAASYTWEGQESFVKQTYRNRCLIRGGVTLSIPVQKVEHKQQTRDIRISYQQRWQHQHWMALVSTYGKTPFWMYYEPYLRPYYERQWDYLVDFNWHLHETILSLLRAEMPTPAIHGAPMLTQEWHPHPIDTYWGSGLSIIDRLCESGNETIALLNTPSSLC